MAKNIHSVTINGQQFTRTSEKHTYTHAVAVSWAASSQGPGGWGIACWSGSKALAEKAARPYAKNAGKGTVLSVVVVEAGGTYVGDHANLVGPWPEAVPAPVVAKDAMAAAL